MPILPLPQFETDLAQLEEEDRKLYESLKAPKTIVVRFGAMKLVGEFPADGSLKPGCGSKLVCRTHRGTEVGEMLTSTCPNSGCAKSVSRQEMLRYIENSGGHDYPFFTEGRVLRLATREDLDRQSELDRSRHEMKLGARRRVEELRLPMKIVEAEPILGGERVTFYYLSEERIDFRELIRLLGADVHTRVELRQVGARDEARLAADYEKCGQYCCCKNFLKVLKPVSMKSAKVQKATLDPLKISGRCGRLMCCLRYEDQTYEELRKNLPRKKTRVGTSDGDGTVIDGQILTQLVLVRLDYPDKDGKFRDIAVPVEDLAPPKSQAPPPVPQAPGSPPGGMRASDRDAPSARRDGGPDARPARPGPTARPDVRPDRRPVPPAPQPPEADVLDDIETDFGDDGPAPGGGPAPDARSSEDASGPPDSVRRRRRRRRRRRGHGGGGPGGAGGEGAPPGGPAPGA